MPKDANVIGRRVAWLRNQRRWSQRELVTELQLLGNINMTREKSSPTSRTLRSPANDKQIEFFAEVFGIMEQDLFPKKRHFVGKEVGMEMRDFTRKRDPPRPPLN